MSLKTGYLVEYGEKKGFFKGIESKDPIICTDAVLIDMLKKRAQYVIWSAKWVNADEYQKNHENKLQEVGF